MDWSCQLSIKQTLGGLTETDRSEQPKNNFVGGTASMCPSTAEKGEAKAISWEAP